MGTGTTFGKRRSSVGEHVVADSALRSDQARGATCAITET
jgi:hypothetical protein